MKRRELIILLGGAAAVWPIAARAQQKERVRLVGILETQDANSPDGQARIAVFVQALAQSGWIVGRNLRLEIRWGSRGSERSPKNAAELVALAPDVIIAVGNTNLGPLLETTRTVPIVFAAVADPVGSGYVESLARPGGNATGFLQFEYSLAAKWLELLKQVAPNVTRAAVLRVLTSIGIGQFSAIQSAGTQLGVDVIPINVRIPSEIERALTAFARSANGGLIVTASAMAVVHRELIVALASRLKLPAVYFARSFVAAGGLISYGPDFLDQYRRATGYVDHILRGEKPGDLPVQAPTKYELVINLKTAKALGLTIPDAVLARADEVIE
jgi:putative ABC transport system substrate-binding protein